MKLDFPTYAKDIAALGREITMESLGGARELIEPLLAVEPFEGVNIQRDIVYGEHERHRLDVFTPSSPEPDRPVLVYVHGGGFIMGDKHTPGSHFLDNIGVWAVEHGFNAINITYRLAPESVWPSGIEDMHSVVSYLQSGKVESLGKAEKVFLIGHSAGAFHSASYLSHRHLYAPTGHGLSGLILMSGLYDFTTLPITEKEQAYIGLDTSTYAEKSSLVGVVDSGVPMLVVMAEHDPDYFQAQSLQLLNAYHQKHKKLPHNVLLAGQNHLSGILCLGLEGDLLGPQLDCFINMHS